MILAKSVLRHKKVHVKVTMTKPFTDYWLDRKPTKSQALEALATLIQLGKLDDHFTVTVEEAIKV